MIDQKNNIKKPEATLATKSKLSSFFKVERKQQTLLVLLLTLILAAAFGYLLTLPLKDSYAANNINFENLKREKESLIAKQDLLKKLSKEKETRADFLKRVEYAMPATAEVPEMLITLETLASDNLLILSNFTPKEVAEETKTTGETKTPKVNYKTVGLEFNVSGSYENLKQFLKDLENNIRPIKILSISINGGGELKKDSVQVLNFSIKSEVYYKDLTK